MLAVVAPALRSWRSAKSVAIFATIAFAVGIGSATAIFTVVRGVLLRPLPYANGDRLVALYGARFSEPRLRSSSTHSDLAKYEKRTTSFDAFGWFRLSNFNLTSPGEPQYLDGAAVTPSLAHSLGARPELGQWFTDETGVVLSNALWRRLGADATIVGQAVTLSGRRLTVTGVMPSGFRLPMGGPGAETYRSDVWVYLDPLDSTDGVLFAYARRKPGVTLAQAEADVLRVAADIAKLDPIGHPSYTARLDDLRSGVVSGIRPTLLLLFAAAVLLLLITCANVATLLLARAVARARETAVRVALGASQRQLALYYFVEGALVSLAGAALGVLLSVVLVRAVVSIAVEYIPRAEAIALDWTVLLFGIAAAFLAGALASLAPLWQAVRTLPNDVLSAGVRASAGAHARRLSQSLVIAEIALAFTLLAVSAILIVHLRNLNRISPGFDPDHLLTFELTVPEARVASAPAGTPAPPAVESSSLVPVQQRLIEALEAIPGVSDAGFSSQIPLAGCCMSVTLHPEGRTSRADLVQRTSFRIVSAAYFRTMRIPLRSGRLPDASDTQEDPLRVVINQAAVAQHWPDRDPIGAFGRLNHAEGNRFQVTGVVGDVRNDALGKPTVPELYLPSSIVPLNEMRFVVRSPLPPARLIPEVRRAVQQVDPTLPIHRPTTMHAIIQSSLVLERVGSLMMMFFAFAALLMATLGIYGVVSYAVRQRTVEFGTRMALGAVSRDILTLVVGGGLRMAAYGVAGGGIAVIAAAWVLVRWFEIRDLGVLPILASTVIVVGVAGVASFLPAWRATFLSPMVAIRDQSASTLASARHSLRHFVKGLAARQDDDRVLADVTLLTEFVAVARRADSFPQALRMALAMLCDKLEAESALLLVRGPGSEYRCAAAAPDAASVDWSLPAEGFLLRRLGVYPHPLPFTSADFDALLQWSARHAPRYVGELQHLEESGARIAVALRTRKEILGVLLLGQPAGRDSYDPGERQLLQNCAEQLALMIENARLTDRVLEQEKLRRDLALAIEVQKRLLPEHPPPAGFVSLAAVSIPARGVGGDYYDFIDAGDHRIGVALADVAGKGVAAALIMSVVQASLRIISSEGELSLPQLAEKMNRFLHRSTASNAYATFFYAQIDERGRQLRYVNAGHNPPYLVRATRQPPAVSPDSAAWEIEELTTGGAVIGLFPDMPYEEASIDLRLGDVLIAFTDGVPEAQDMEGGEFGEQRLKDLLFQVAHLPAAEISARIAQELTSWIGDAAQYDDLTFIVMKVNQSDRDVLSYQS